MKLSVIKRNPKKGRKNVCVRATAERNIYGSVTLVSARHSSTPFTLESRQINIIERSKENECLAHLFPQQLWWGGGGWWWGPGVVAGRAGGGGGAAPPAPRTRTVGTRAHGGGCFSCRSHWRAAQLPFWQRRLRPERRESFSTVPTSTVKNRYIIEWNGME